MFPFPTSYYENFKHTEKLKGLYSEHYKPYIQCVFVNYNSFWYLDCAIFCPLESFPVASVTLSHSHSSLSVSVLSGQKYVKCMSCAFPASCLWNWPFIQVFLVSFSGEWYLGTTFCGVRVGYSLLLGWLSLLLLRLLR